MTHQSRYFYRLAGFSLLELAIVLFVVALLLGGMVLPLSAQRDQQQHNTTRKTMEEVRDALLGFAAANGRVPCPAVSPLSVEAPAGGHCTTASGYVPGPTLGVLADDAWGRPLHYAVATSYAVVTYTPPPQPECPPSGTLYRNDAATTANGLMLAMPCLVTDLRACSNGTRNTYVISGAGSCAALWHSIGDGLVVAVWSDGPDNTIATDDLTIWPALPSLAKMIAIGQNK